MRRLTISAICIASVLLLSSATLLSANDYRSVFQQFKLDNSYGKQVALDEFADKPVVVLAFLGTECPLAKLYGPRLNALHRQYSERGVVFLGINSNKQDSLTELNAYVHRFEIEFPMLKDVGNRLADALQATRTPEVFVFDSARDLRYHGRIDDQYGVGYARGTAEQSDLKIAIDELLAGKPVSTPETKAIGCIIGRVKQVAASGEVTYSKDIAPILNARCVQCHREGEIGPFTLTSYDDVPGWEETILEVIEDNRMPPWNANPDYGHFANDARLSQEEVLALRTWIANGMPEGDPGDLPPAPSFIEGWRIPEPDQVFAMRDLPFDVPAEGVVDYQRFIVDPGWTEDKYVFAAEARPQNRSVVHHILVYIIPPGSRGMNLRHVLVGYAPGSLPVHYEDGLAIKVPAGSRFVFEMHYTPNGIEQSDLSYAGVCFIDKEKVTRIVEGQMAITQNFRIPPYDPGYEVTAQYRSRKDELLLSMTPHMHVRGKSFRYEAFYPDGEQEILLDVPNYDFNWQLKYILQQPKKLPEGTRILCTAVYDNSEKNLVNPDPSRSVTWGDQSWEEMMIGFLDTVPVK
jgi:peroxiredoxin